jgi:hypothetical protein
MRAFRSGPEAEEKETAEGAEGEQLKACVIDAERIAGSQAIKKQSANSASSRPDATGPHQNQRS